MLSGRIACFGDSHVQGDNWEGAHVPPGRGVEQHRRYKWFNVNCRLPSLSCRGNFPRVLQGLLGPSVDVRNFGLTGRSAGDFVRSQPDECFAQGSPLNVSWPATLRDVTRLTQQQNASACAAAIRRGAETVFAALEAFAAHHVVLMIGTNDAIHGAWSAKDRPEVAFVLALSGLLHALWEVAPSILMLEQPPTMGDNLDSWRAPIKDPTACIRMHTCVFHSSRPCLQVRECISCSKTDRLESDLNPSTRRPFQHAAWSSCLRADALRQVRRLTGLVTIALQTLDGSTIDIGRQSDLVVPMASSSQTPLQSATQSQTERMVSSPPPVRRRLHFIDRTVYASGPERHSGPYHLSARSSALLACTIFAEMTRLPCGTGYACLRLQRDGALGAEAPADAARRLSLTRLLPPFNRTRAEAFCRPLVLAANGQRTPLRENELNTLEHDLFYG